MGCVAIAFRVRANLDYQRQSRLHGCKSPPGLPQIDPVFGLDLLLTRLISFRANRRNVSLLEHFRRYGNTFQSKTFGQTTIFTIEPRNLQSVFSTNFSSWGVEPMRLFAFEPFVGKGIMCSDGAFWEHSRALIKPTFARTQIADLHLDAFGIHVQRLIDLIPKDGSTFDLQPLFARLALDSSTEFLFGESVEALDPDITSSTAKSFLAAYDYGQSGVGRRILLPQFNFLTIDRRFWEACKTAHDFVDRQIQKALLLSSQEKHNGNNPGRYILTHELLRETGNLLDIRHQLLNIFLPAHEAIGVALTNIYFNLARHPLIYSKLRKEILDANLSPRDMTFERLKSLRYLQFVISETFRLNPTIGTNSRMALKDTILPTGGGSSGYGTSPILVRKGDIVVFGFYALHRMPSIFGDDVDVFRPERWETLRPAHWSYLPFGGGLRVCPGQQLALTEIGYCLVRLMRVFERVENRDPVTDFVEHYKITTESKNGAKVAVMPSHA
ncbi:MAG: hypothetical protein Q9192_001066 [Flavoplaca navasiana]